MSEPLSTTKSSPLESPKVRPSSQLDLPCPHRLSDTPKELPLEPPSEPAELVMELDMEPGMELEG